MSRPWNRTLPIDASIAVILGVAIAITTIPAADGDPGEMKLDAGGFAVIGGTALCLTFRRFWPVTTLLATFAGTMLYTLLGYPYGPIFVLMAVAMGSVAAYRSRRVAIIVCAVMVVAHLPYSIVADSDDDSPIVNIAISVIWLVVSTVTGLAFKQARESRIAARQQEQQRYLSEERLRIAGEVHDVVGHSLAVISMQAGVALHVAQRNDAVPTEVTDSLAAIRGTGSAALEELRSTLAALGGPQDRQPALKLSDIDTTVAAMRSDGLRIHLDIDGVAGPVPSAVDSAGYRIVQEALTNVVKHADASQVRVRIEYRPGLVTLSVTDNGRTADAEPEYGRGLSGMAERARALGGGFSAGAKTTGGFGVRAELPYSIVEP